MIPSTFLRGMKNEVINAPIVRAAEASSPKPRQAEAQPSAIPANVPGKARYRILFIERRPMLREWFKGAIKREPGLTLCGSAGDCADIRSIHDGITRFAPHLVVVGTGHEGGTPLEVIAKIMAEPKPPPVLCIAAAEDELEAMAMLRAGARGYVSCFDPPGRIWLALRVVLAGGIHLSERIAMRVVERLLFPQHDGNAGLAVDSLSGRELEVFKLIGRGDAPSEIAGKIKLSVKTVENYRARVMEKLGVKGARTLFRVAMKWVSEQSQ